MTLERIRTETGAPTHYIRAAVYELAVSSSPVIDVASPAFAYSEPLPMKYTMDGKGESPPLEWRGVPQHTEALVVLIEDADSPTLEPALHALLCNLPVADGAVAEGGMREPNRKRREHSAPQNPHLVKPYVPPDPPPGDGIHRYVFQVFALDSLVQLDRDAPRRSVLDALRGRVLARGFTIGTYERGPEDPTPLGSDAPFADPPKNDGLDEG